jgi:hypothetical protein
MRRIGRRPSPISKGKRRPTIKAAVADSSVPADSIGPSCSEVCVAIAVSVIGASKFPVPPTAWHQSH